MRIPLIDWRFIFFAFLSCGNEGGIDFIGKSIDSLLILWRHAERVTWIKFENKWSRNCFTSPHSMTPQSFLQEIESRVLFGMWVCVWVCCDRGKWVEDSSRYRRSEFDSFILLFYSISLSAATSTKYPFDDNCFNKLFEFRAFICPL